MGKNLPQSHLNGSKQASVRCSAMITLSRSPFTGTEYHTGPVSANAHLSFYLGFNET